MQVRAGQAGQRSKARTLFLAFTSAPSSNSTRMQSTLPSEAAFKSGERPPCHASRASERQPPYVATSGAPFCRTHVVFGLKLCAQLHQHADALYIAIISGF